MHSLLNHLVDCDFVVSRSFSGCHDFLDIGLLVPEDLVDVLLGQEGNGPLPPTAFDGPLLDLGFECLHDCSAGLIS